MKLKEIMNTAYRLGTDADPRGRTAVEQDLADKRERFEKLSEKEKECYDVGQLENPYADTRLLVGDAEAEVRLAIAGIDMETQEILLADRLREKGQPIDLVIAHHPEGAGLAQLHQVMHLQEGVMQLAGVPVNVAEDIMAERIGVVSRAFSSANHYRAVDAARLLGFNFICVHTPADNLAASWLSRHLEKEAPRRLCDVLEALDAVPEYHQASLNEIGPRIIVGDRTASAGKIYVDFTGGTSGPEDTYENLARAGVGTVICMHMGEANRKAAKKHHVHVIVASHMASDSLGMNQFLDALEAGGMEIIPASGLLRVKRN